MVSQVGSTVNETENLFGLKDYELIGCYVEKGNDRDLTKRMGTNLDDKECAMACQSYDWFGLQGTNLDCWCGDSFGKHGEAENCGECPKPGNGKQCVYGYFDSVQPPVRTLADCEPDLLESTLEICANAMVAEGIDEDAKDEFLLICKWDVCFGGKEFAAEDAWTAHMQAPCATLADVQGVCGVDVGSCAEDAALAPENCKMSACKKYTDLGWWGEYHVRILADGQAIGDGTLTSKLELDHRPGICLSALGDLELCTVGQCSRTSGGLRAQFFHLPKHIKLTTEFSEMMLAPDMVRIDDVVYYPTTPHAWPGMQVKDKFLVEWYGRIKITLAGPYTFYITSDDGSVLTLDEEVAVDNDGLHAMKVKEATVELSTGLHTLNLRMFERGGWAGMIMEYAGPDTKGVKAVVPRGVLVPGQVTTTTTTGVVGGLKAEFFYLHGVLTSVVGVLDGKMPDLVRIDETVNYPGTSAKWPGLTKSDTFAARWTGSVLIKQGGEYEFEVTSDDGSMLSIDGGSVVLNDGLHPMLTKSGVVELHAGPHFVDLQYFENTGAAGIALKYKGPDTGHNVTEVRAGLVESALLEVGTDQELATSPIVPQSVLTPFHMGGLKAQFFYLASKPSTTAAITSDLVADVTRVDEVVQYQSTSGTWSGLTNDNNFAARWTGGIMIYSTGDYTFHLGSDDGSQLYINGDPVVNNDGLHAMRREEATIELQRGVHAIDLKFIEASGHAGMIFEYSGPDTDDVLEVVPPSALVMPEDMLAKFYHTTTSTTGMEFAALPGGLLAEFMYLTTWPGTVNIVVGQPVDVDRVDTTVNYLNGASAWSGLSPT
eukprot:3187411-Amphidinium_carterae.1